MSSCACEKEETASKQLTDQFADKRDRGSPAERLEVGHCVNAREEGVCGRRLLSTVQNRRLQQKNKFILIVSTIGCE